ncbi:MAG TPA: ankyrin repeat domain-containing protein [Gallionella sp.]
MNEKLLHLMEGYEELYPLNLDGWTPLHKAAANGHIEMVKLLLAIKNQHQEIEALLSATS